MNEKLDMKNTVVILENETGRNEKFFDKKTKKEYTRNEIVNEIEDKKRTGYIRVVNGVKVPCRMPRKNK